MRSSSISYIRKFSSRILNLSSPQLSEKYSFEEQILSWLEIFYRVVRKLDYSAKVGHELDNYHKLETDRIITRNAGK